MKRKAITTSAKRAESILRTERAKLWLWMESTIEQRVRAEVTRLCSALEHVDDDERMVTIGSVPAYRQWVVALPDGLPGRSTKCATDVVFLPVEKRWRHEPSGTVVRWFDWKPAGPC